MAYIIENIPLLKNDKVEDISILVQDNRIQSIRRSFPKYNFMKMAVHSFLMTPTYVLLLPWHFIFVPLENQRQYFCEEVIKKGSTMFLTYVDIDREYKLQTTLHELHMKLLNCPVDYAVAVKIPIRLLTTSFIRKCKKEKVAAIFIDLDTGNLQDIPWGWIREALFPFNCPLIPYTMEGNKRKRARKLKEWANILAKEKLPFLESELEEKEPIPFQVLVKLGIYPIKYGIHQGGEVTYNLYHNLPEMKGTIQERELFVHHEGRLAITVHRGSVIRVQEKVIFRPGYGEYVPIFRPGFFTS